MLEIFRALAIHREHHVTGTEADGSHRGAVFINADAREPLVLGKILQGHFADAIRENRPHGRVFRIAPRRGGEMARLAIPLGDGLRVSFRPRAVLLHDRQRHRGGQPGLGIDLRVVIRDFPGFGVLPGVFVVVDHPLRLIRHRHAILRVIIGDLVCPDRLLRSPRGDQRGSKLQADFGIQRGEYLQRLDAFLRRERGRQQCLAERPDAVFADAAPGAFHAGQVVARVLGDLETELAVPRIDRVEFLVRLQPFAAVNALKADAALGIEGGAGRGNFAEPRNLVRHAGIHGNLQVGKSVVEPEPGRSQLGTFADELRRGT